VELLLLACAIAAVLPGRAGPPWWRRGGVSLPSVAVPLLVLPAGLLLLESVAARPLYVDRYVLYGEAAVALLAGAGAYRIGRWLAGVAGAGKPGMAGAGKQGAAGSGPAARGALLWLPGVAVCLCALLLQLGAQHRARTPQSRLFDFGGPSRYLAAHARPGDGVLFLSDFFRKAELGYPAEFRHVSDFSLAVSPAQAGTFQGIDKPVGTVGTLMLGHSRIWTVGRPPSAALPTPAARAESAVLQRHFRRAGERHFKGIVVILWLRG
jgi:mannosyltransferase